MVSILKGCGLAETIEWYLTYGDGFVNASSYCYHCCHQDNDSLLCVNPQITAKSAPLFLQCTGRLLAAPHKTKYSSPNCLFTSGVRIKPANRGSLKYTILSYSLFTLLRDFQLFQVHKFLVVDGGRTVN